MRPQLSVSIQESMTTEEAVPNLFRFSGRLGRAGQPVPPGVTITGSPLEPQQLWLALDLTRVGLERVRAAVEARDQTAAAAALLAYYRERREPGWMTGPPLRSASRRLEVRAAELPKLAIENTDREIAGAAERQVFRMLDSHTPYAPHDYGLEINWDANPANDIEWIVVVRKGKI